MHAIAILISGAVGALDMPAVSKILLTCVPAYHQFVLISVVILVAWDSEGLQDPKNTGIRIT